MFQNRCSNDTMPRCGFDFRSFSISNLFRSTSCLTRSSDDSSSSASGACGKARDDLADGVLFNTESVSFWKDLEIRGDFFKAEPTSIEIRDDLDELAGGSTLDWWLLMLDVPPTDAAKSSKSFSELIRIFLFNRAAASFKSLYSSDSNFFIIASIAFICSAASSYFCLCTRNRQ